MPSFNYEILNEQYSYYNGHTSYGIKIIGYSHLRKNIPCQDSFKIWTSNKTNSVIYSIADGHGDPRYDFAGWLPYCSKYSC